jgi:hypothetical protein
MAFLVYQPPRHDEERSHHVANKVENHFKKMFFRKKCIALQRFAIGVCLIKNYNL